MKIVKSVRLRSKPAAPRWAKQVAKKGEIEEKEAKKNPQGLKPTLIFRRSRHD